MKLAGWLVASAKLQVVPCLDHIGPGRAAIAADLDLLAGDERAVGAGDRQRGVVGDEVGRRRAGVAGNRRDRQRFRRRRGVDGDRLAGGGADIAGGVHDPRLIGEARRMRVVGSTRLQVVAVSGATSVQVVPPSLLTWIFSPAAERAVGARDRQRGVAGDEVGR